MRLPLTLVHPYPRHGRGSFMFQRSPTHRHRGVDFAAPEGTPVVAVGDGVVEHAVTDGTPGFRGYGHAIVLRLSRLDGVRALYAHLKTVDVSRGDRVTDGQVIGTVGKSGVVSSGPHLHFELASRAYPMAAEAERLDPGFFLGRVECPNAQS